MTKEVLLPEDKDRLKQLYVAYHSPWNEAHLQEIFKKEIDWIWSHYRKIK